MPLHRSLLTKTLLLAACLVVVAAVPAGSATKVLFPSACAKPSYKPPKIVVTCGDANNVLTKIKWSTWTSTSATGAGTSLVNDCTPNCASGHAVKSKANVKLSKPKDCGKGVTQFTKLVETYPDAKPGSQGSTVSEKFPCNGP